MRKAVIVMGNVKRRCRQRKQRFSGNQFSSEVFQGAQNHPDHSEPGEETVCSSSEKLLNFAFEKLDNSTDDSDTTDESADDDQDATAECDFSGMGTVSSTLLSSSLLFRRSVCAKHAERVI